MEKLIDVLILIIKKYIDRCNVIVEKNILTLEYHTYIGGEIDVFETVQITEFEEKLKLKFIREKHIKIMEIDEFDSIFEILKMQEQYKKPSKEELKYIIKEYPEGTKIKLEKLYDIVNDIKSGTVGTIKGITENRTLKVAWENGINTELYIGRDKFIKI